MLPLKEFTVFRGADEEKTCWPLQQSLTWSFIVVQGQTVNYGEFLCDSRICRILIAKVLLRPSSMAVPLPLGRRKASSTML